MSKQFDAADFSFVVKRRGNPPKPWRWEIYRAGKNDPVERSAVFFESMAEALKEGKKALVHLLANRWRDSGGPTTNNQGIKSTDNATILQSCAHTHCSAAIEHHQAHAEGSFRRNLTI